jgi:replicative DNA helicase
MVEKQIIKLFCIDKTLYTKYYNLVNIDYIRNNYPLVFKLFLTVHTYYSKYPQDTISKGDLEICYNSNYLLKDSERTELKDVIDSIFELETNRDLLISLLEEHRQRALAGDVAKVALNVEIGKSSVDDLIKLLGDFDSKKVISKEVKFVDANIKRLYETQVATVGLRWRLKFLNQSLGSLRKGDFGFIFARPETGKTTFLASEISHMITQTEGNILWFNNEEYGDKVITRCLQAVLGVTAEELWSKPDEYQAKYDALTGGRIKLLDVDDSNTATRIEEIIKAHNPALIIFDQIDKIKGFKGERNDLELKAIYQWAREIAKMYAPVIAVSQASGEGDDKLWLSMNMVDGSKTAKQGEADWMLGIGKEANNTSRFRYFNILKNKLLGDKDTLPAQRHGNARVLIKPEIARYEDL